MIIARGSIAQTVMSMIDSTTSTCIAKAAFTVSTTIVQAIHTVPCIRERVEFKTKCPSIINVFTIIMCTVNAGIDARIRVVTWQTKHADDIANRTNWLVLERSLHLWRTKVKASHINVSNKLERAKMLLLSLSSIAALLKRAVVYTPRISLSAICSLCPWKCSMSFALLAWLWAFWS